MGADGEGIKGLSNWNFRTQHVQRELEPQDFINASTVLICAGPPRLVSPGDLDGVSKTEASSGGAGGASYLFPIGIVENMTMVSNRQLQILFEIGSKRQFYVPGRVVPQISLSRTVFNGPNILRALYAYYPAENLPGRQANIVQPYKGAGKEQQLCDVLENPGHIDFWINLNSDLFDRPFGLLIIMKDQCDNPYASFYLENAFINNHQLSVNASSTLVGEGTTIQFERVVPVDIGAKPTFQKTGAQAAAG
jgi:hypothetical protein